MRHEGYEESSEQHILILWAPEYCASMRSNLFANPSLACRFVGRVRIDVPRTEPVIAGRPIERSSRADMIDPFLSLRNRLGKLWPIGLANLVAKDWKRIQSRALWADGMWENTQILLP